MLTTFIHFLLASDISGDDQFWLIVLERYGLTGALLLFVLDLIAKGIISKVEKLIKKVDKAAENSAQVKSKQKDFVETIHQRIDRIESLVSEDSAPTSPSSGEIQRSLNEATTTITSRGRQRDNLILDNIKKLQEALKRIEGKIDESAEKEEKSWRRRK